MPTTAVRANTSGYGVINAVAGVCLDCMTGPVGATLGQHLGLMVSRSDSQGTPSVPSLAIHGVGLYQFRWVIRVGTQTIRIQCKEILDLTPRPTLTVLKDSALGINSDQVATAPSGADWKTIGPLSISATAVGVALVQLKNNVVSQYTDCYFDLLVAT